MNDVVLAEDAARRNRAWWNAGSDEYQDTHGPLLKQHPLAWGVWRIPEADLQVLGDVRGKDLLELGCGAAQWSIALAQQGARPVGLDMSARQLTHARRLMREAGVRFPLVLASAERAPLAAGGFDAVFCDFGAMTFARPEWTVPEAARLLRPGGLLAFTTTSPPVDMCWPDDEHAPTDRLRLAYFGLHAIADDETVRFQLPYGEWIRLFRRHGFLIEDLIELRPEPDTVSSYWSAAARDWALQWPAECLWKVRKAGG
ncbi:MAG: class I SAM-dependent methyltransferase [Chloroflexi bacterium]|nr:class I SAM-dependent methyltransferase [Chloroflexota bacterium]